MSEPTRRSRRSALARGLAAAAIPAAVGVAAWEISRRRGKRALEADPEWPELRAPERGRELDVVSSDGTRIHAEVFGPDGAPAIVLAHGWTCDTRFWHFQIRELAGECRLVAYDQRGHGRSAHPGPDGYSSDALGDDLQAVLEAALAPGERCVLAGHSMGGMTLVAWAGRHPEEVRRRAAAAMLLDTGMGDLAAQSLIIEGVLAKKLLATPLESLMGVPARLPATSTPLSRRLYRHFVMGPGVSETRVAFCEQMLIDCPAKVRAGFARQFSTIDLYEAVPRLTVPASIVVGELDRLEPPWHSRRLAETLPEVVELAEIPGVGHMVPVEVPDEVNRRLRALVRDHLGTPELAAAGG